MFVRVVHISCKTGMEDELRQIGRNVLVPVNMEAGCLSVYFLEPSAETGNPFFGVVSIWANNETLNNMKNSEKYQALLQNLNPLIESSSDYLYVTN
jgi:quinol monooxygenase YgiN